MNILRKITVKNLVKNRTRTIVTIIGIILSLAMFTAVTTCVSSLRDYLISVFSYKDGSWYGAVFDIPDSMATELAKNEKMTSSVTVGNIGYVEIPSENEYKPYIFISEISEDASTLLPIHITSGRMPENASEIIVPEHLAGDGKVKYTIGDAVTFEIGQRSLGGALLNQQNCLDTDETFTPEKTASYTVVGVYERPHFEPYSAPGYTVLTCASEKSVSASFDFYFRTKLVWSAKTVLGECTGDYGKALNKDLLRMSGATSESDLNGMIYGLAGILMPIIMFGSVSLIYNSFSISVSERTKQFGLMKSIGATKKQMTQSVLFEALVLCVVGVPLGILAGIAGMAVTFKYTSGMFDSFFGSVENIHFGMHISAAGIAAAVVVGIITVLISAYIPSKRASRQSPIEAIHQTADINVKPRSVKTSKLTYKLFGFEGMLASKNYKRSRKKYRTTVLSLFMSVVLFITATSFCSYLKASLGEKNSVPGSDIELVLDEGEYSNQANKKLLGQIKSTESVESASMALIVDVIAFFEESQLTEKALEKFIPKYGMNSMIVFIDDASFSELLKKENIDVASHTDAEHPLGVLYCIGKEYNKAFATDTKYTLVDAESATIRSEKELYRYNGFYIHNENIYDEQTDSYETTDRYVYTDDNGTEHYISKEDITYTYELSYSGIVDSLIDAIPNKQLNDIPTFVYPYSAAEKVLDSAVIKDEYVHYSVCSDSPKTAYDEIAEILKSTGIDYLHFINYNKSAVAEKAMSTVIEIFSYGFITLISLIAAANVFNTISTNIMLRRREFAMLKSVGMTQKGFRKMMNYECILYGVKGLLAGISVSIGLTYLIYSAVKEEFTEIGFYIPWISFAIAIGSVFLVVFAAMLYSMKKISGDNPVETLKNENL